MARDIQATYLSVPKALAIGLVVSALSCATTYWVGWSGVQQALARYEAQRAGDLALNSQVHDQISADLREVKVEQRDLRGRLDQVSGRVAELAAAGGRRS